MIYNFKASDFLIKTLQNFI